MTTQSEYRGPTGPNNSSDRYLRQQEVLQRVGTSPVNLRRWEKIGIFPQRYKIGPNSVAWKESEVNQWFADRQVASASKKEGE